MDFPFLLRRKMRLMRCWRISTALRKRSGPRSRLQNWRKHAWRIERIDRAWNFVEMPRSTASRMKWNSWTRPSARWRRNCVSRGESCTSCQFWFAKFSKEFKQIWILFQWRNFWVAWSTRVNWNYSDNFEWAYCFWVLRSKLRSFKDFLLGR